MDINREELAWAGGLFEGEGTFSDKKRNGRTVAIKAAIKMTDLDVLQRFQRAVGVGSISGPYQITTAKGNESKPIYTWAISSFEGTQAVIAMLWPWLQSRRRVKAKALIAAFMTQPRENTRWGKRWGGLKKAASEVVRLRAEGLTQQAIADRLGFHQGSISELLRSDYK